LKAQAIQDWEVNAVATSFAKAAKQYDTAARLQRTVGSMLFETLGDQLTGTQSVLDIGAGTGFCTELLASSGANVIAVDIAPAMLIQAWQRLGTKASYMAADTQSIALQNNTVDIIFANLVLQWCVDLSAVFAEFKRVLKTDGHIVFSTLGPQTLWELRTAWQQVDQYRHVNDFMNTRDLESQFQQIGLSGSLEKHNIQLEYSSPMQLMQEIKTLGAVNMSPSRQRGLMGKKRLQRVCDEYNALMGKAETRATWEIVLGQLKIAQ
jgi:malonyl-CoA O-methyltransferase